MDSSYAGEKLRIAVVTPWFGESLKGGAEQLAWQLATRLSLRGHSVTVLTTCCRSFQDDWGTNHLDAGSETVGTLTVKRFLVNPRNATRFDQFNGELLSLDRQHISRAVKSLPKVRSDIWVDENINSTGLTTHIKQSFVDHDAFLFLPYLYGVVINGIAAAATKAVVQPCLHDEAYAYLPAIKRSFTSASAILCNSEGELSLLSKLFSGQFGTKATVVGTGVEVVRSSAIETQQPADAFPEPLVDGDFFLCLGRRDPGKGVDFLCQAFVRARAAGLDGKFKLVLAGPGGKSYEAIEDNIFDLGLVNEATKIKLIERCRALCQPSINESFSRVLYEAWLCGRPAIVHGECDATEHAVRRCEGGWIARTSGEWTDQLIKISNLQQSELDAVALKGNIFAHEIADWDSCMQRYEAVISSIKRLHTLPRSDARAVHQVLPNLNPGDAISNQARLWQRWLRELGFTSNIFVIHLHPDVSSDAVQILPEQLSGYVTSNDAIIYHHSIGSPWSDVVAKANVKNRLLVYHNITPPEFFAGYSAVHEYLCRTGREELWALARQFPNSVGDSTYNVEELKQFGFASPRVMPLAVPPPIGMKASGRSDQRGLDAGRTEIIFVGRIAPNKRQVRIVEIFAQYLVLDPTARLTLVGSGAVGEPYYDKLISVIAALGIADSITVVGHVSDEELNEIYTTATLFICLSEHEGFCVPLVEAMWRDVPILALSRAAIVETMGESSYVLADDHNAVDVAVEIYRMTHLTATRSTQIDAQRMSRERFHPNVVKPQFESMIEMLTHNVNAVSDVATQC